MGDGTSTCQLSKDEGTSGKHFSLDNKFISVSQVIISSPIVLQRFVCLPFTALEIHIFKWSTETRV